jgi:hypothetical protein
MYAFSASCKALVALCVATYATFAMPACRPDGELDKLQTSIAKRNFPTLMDKPLPRIVSCNSRSDMPGAVGYFSPSEWKIAILRGVTNHPVEVVVAHELGHALDYKLGTSTERFGGHGIGWLRVMVRPPAVQSFEARRTAELTDHYPGLLAVYKQVEREEFGKKPPPTDPSFVDWLRGRPEVLDWLLQPVD